MEEEAFGAVALAGQDQGEGSAGGPVDGMVGQGCGFGLRGAAIHWGLRIPAYRRG